MAWTATITSVEYQSPTYNCVVMMKKNNVETSEEMMYIENTRNIDYVTNEMRNMIKSKEEAESLGAELNDMIGTAIKPQQAQP